MKSGERILMAAALMGCGAWLVRGELEPWLQHIPAGPVLTTLFRSVPMPGGAAMILLPPAESRPALTKLISGAPRDAMLYRLRAREDEMALDFTAAEADWKTYAQTASDRYSAQIEVADFYHRRMRARDELAALTAAAAAPDDPGVAAAAQRGWQAFERMAAVTEQEAVPEPLAEPVFRAWVTRYPKEPEAWRKLIAYLSAQKKFAAAEIEIAKYGRAFHDEWEPVRMRADLEIQRGRAATALAIYDRAFQPLWPEALRTSYFKLLEQEEQLREFAGRARRVLEANPTDLNATARLFHYFRSQNNAAAARRVLLEYRTAKESGKQAWTAGELETLAQLFEWLPDVNEAARLYYALYSVPPGGGAQEERALYRLANLLLANSAEPIQFGAGDLSFYKDIATVDPSPGFLNGILSLVLNSTGMRWGFEQQNQKSGAYFHRAAAEQLVALLERRFPKSEHREALRAMLISAYGAYGEDAAVIRAGRAYLAAFPSGAGRVAVAMQVADALARANRTTEEFALYDQMLRELAAKSYGKPIRAGANANEAAAGTYVQVLEKYLARLAMLKRRMEALQVYRREIDRNPNDPGLYERLAAFLEQNGLGREVEELYTQAMAKFPDRTWYHKLARWYLRNRETSAFEKISRQAIAIFSGSELDLYFGQVVAQDNPDAVLYRQLNLYAHERFPEDMVFVHNLLSAYSRKGTYDPDAAERLLRQYWFYDREFRWMLFERLWGRGRLYPELAEIQRANPGIMNGQFDQALASNPAAVQFAMEAEAWLCHFEAAAPAARALATAYPGRDEFTVKASAIYRSLAAYDPKYTDAAVAMASYQQQAEPRDQAILARMGDILADREQFGRARQFWERIPAEQPNKQEAYLDTATIYWDYYLYGDALRWITAARKHFHDPALFAYQAGAIEENKRDYPSAVREYMAGALAGQSDAKNRLLRLLNRPRTRELVEKATAGAVASNPAPEAVSLRIAALEAQQRRKDLEALLEARVNAEKSSTELASLQQSARRLGFDAIEERASERLAGITNDPVDQMRLTLDYMRLLESKKEIAGAARVADGLYREHPMILGVIRGAVDFHVRNHQPGEAMDILLDAAKHARTDLAAQFTLESAQIATDAGMIDRARTLLAALLAADPLRADYLAAMADTYLKAKDDSGFRDYELATIQRLKQSQLTPAERAAEIAAIRRSLIPVLDRMKDSAGAVDQYIEVINSFPEDETLTQEAAAYAVAHGQTARLEAFYRKAIGEAPRDYRWPIVEARIETVAEAYPAAIADYERAIKARPDRADVVEAKGGLEERLMRFDDAIKSYGRLYELSYQNPQWLTKVAELQARTAQGAAAVNSLKTAVTGARNETADADFTIAERLEAWHMLPDAVAFCERGARRAGSDLFQDEHNAVIYARIMTRARRPETVLARLGNESLAEQAVAQAVGKIVAELYSPEDKTRLEQALSARAAQLPRLRRDAVLLPLANAAGLADLEARWRYESMRAEALNVDARFVTLQSERGLYGELGRQLEEYAAETAGQPVAGIALTQAAEAYIAAGDVDSQLRVMRTALQRNELGGGLLNRYLSLLARRQPDELLRIARQYNNQEIGNRAVQFAIASERPDLAYAAIRNRGAARDPVWTRAFMALAGLYYDDRSAAIDGAFQAALDTRTIGERLKTVLKPDSIIAGTVWFYYGARYGDYLELDKNAAAGNWLPAMLEAAPGNPGAYVALGDSYAEAGHSAQAMDEYKHALELDADRGDAHDHIARMLWSEGRRQEAIAAWKTALATFLRIQSRGVKVPETFWNRVEETFNDIGQRHAAPDLQNEIAHLLGDYYQRNHEYRLQELIEAAVRASLESGTGTGWVVELARSMENPEWMFEALLRAHGLSDAERIELQRDLVEVRARQAAAQFGEQKAWAETQLAQARWELTAMLLEAGRVQEATAAWREISADDAKKLDLSLEIRLAAATGTLDGLILRYRTDPDAPPADTLQRAAVALRRDGDEKSARTVLEFMYDREIRNGHLDAPNFLGLAEVDLERGDSAAAVALLNRMALVVTDGFETLMPAAELLGKYGRTTESVEFMRRRLKAVPWDAQAKVRLAAALAAGSAERERLVTAVVTDRDAAYKYRAEAARMAAPRPAAGVSGTELALLAADSIAPEAAERLFYVEARIKAADESSDPEVKLRLWRGALAIAPAEGRVRLGTLRAAVALQRDSFVLAVARTGTQPEYRRAGKSPVLPQIELSNDERAAIAESLAAASERLDDLNIAANYLRAAMDLRPKGAREALERHLKILLAEQDRREKNAARQPVIKEVIEQDTVVRPRMVRSAQ